MKQKQHIGGFLEPLIPSPQKKKNGEGFNNEHSSNELHPMWSITGTPLDLRCHGSKRGIPHSGGENQQGKKLQKTVQLKYTFQRVL